MLKKINTIIEGDCIVELAKIPTQSIDLIFADPPYWMQTEGVLLRTNGTKFHGVEDEWDKFSSYSEYDAFCKKWLSECKRILKKDGAIWVIGSFQNIYRIGYIMQNLGFWIINDIIWAKPNAVPNFAGTRFQNSHETLLFCTTSKNAKYTFNYKTMKFLNAGKQEKSIWTIPICQGKERLRDCEGQKVHPTQKPEKLLQNIILSSTKPNDIILDPFFGTGTTGVIAKKLGRNFIGIEKESKYIVAAEQRIKCTKQELTELSNLSLEKKPPRVSILLLLQKKLLFPGELLFDVKHNYIGTLTKEALVNDGQECLSIHKMAAKKLNRVAFNGWTFFYVQRDKSLISIDSLRYKYEEENHAGTNP